MNRIQREAFTVRAGSKLVVEKIPFFILAATGSAVTYLVQSGGGAVWQTPLPERLANAAIAYASYVLKMIRPTDLCIVYSHPKHWPVLVAAGAVVLLLVWTIPIVLNWRRYPYLAVGWFWFLGTLVPTIGIVQVGGQSMAERYTYLPFIGLFIAVVWLVGDAVVKLPKLKLAAQLLSVAVIIACAIKTDAQVMLWKDMETLFGHVLEVDPRGEIPNLNLGIAYMKQGNNVEAQEYIERAMVYNNPGSNTRLFLGDVLQAQGKLDQTAQEYRQALAASPNSYDGHNDLGILLGKQGLAAQALEQFRLAEAIQPETATAHSNAAWILTETRQLPQAIDEFTQALRFDPTNASTHNNLGVALLQLGNFAKAAEQFNDAIKIDLSYADPRRNLVLALAGMKSKKVDQANK